MERHPNSHTNLQTIYLCNGTFLNINPASADTCFDAWKEGLAHDGDKDCLFLSDRHAINLACVAAIQKGGVNPYAITVYMEGGSFLRMTNADGQRLSRAWKCFESAVGEEVLT